MIIDQLRIGETLEIGGGATENRDPVRNYDELFSRYITEVDIVLDTQQVYSYRVNSFELLYALVILIYNLKDREDFDISVGEGLYFRGECMDDVYLLDLRRDSVPLVRFELTTTEMVMFLSKKVVELAMSLRHIGVDVRNYVRQFPPVL